MTFKQALCVKLDVNRPQNAIINQLRHQNRISENISVGKKKTLNKSIPKSFKRKKTGEIKADIPSVLTLTSDELLGARYTWNM